MSTTSFDLLTPDQQDLRQMVHSFADEEIIPTCKELEIEGIFPEELYKKAYEMGLTTMILPEKYGGMGLDIFTYSICKEELARGDAGFAGAVAGSFMGSLPARLFGTEYQIKTVTELLCNGGAMAFALTEAELRLRRYAHDIRRRRRRLCNQRLQDLYLRRRACRHVPRIRNL